MRKYNFIYSKLIKGDNDFVGIVAYALYKKQKIVYVGEYKKENSNKDIPEEELEKFHKICSSDDSIIGYRRRAEDIINKFYKNALEKKGNEIEEFYKNSSQHKKSWWYGVAQGFASSFLYALFLGIVLVILWASKTDLFTIIKVILEGRH